MVHAAAPRATGGPHGAPGVGGSFVLKKHEAAGNDFLVHVDAGSTWVPSAAFVRWVCDRRRGVGADGLMLARPAGAGADLEMLLYNADGSRAEMSGNGIRCLVQAAVMTGLAEPGVLRVRTDAGVRRVEYAADGEVASASVDMGAVDLGAELEVSLPGARARRASVGNPHVVVVDRAGTEAASGTRPEAAALASVDLEGVAEEVTELLGEQVNVEVVRLTGVDSLALRVFERGVGETAACGTGSCAAAAVARSFGLVADVVRVENPGGTLSVRLGSTPDAPVSLSGPVRHVADVVLAPTALGAAARP